MTDELKKSDGANVVGTPWVYTDEVKRHFLHPANFAETVPEKYNGLGLVGSPACGDMMKVWLWIDPETETIKDFKWQTFGCASAIASTSALSELITENGGMSIVEAMKVTPKDIINRLNGLPDRKVHCSVLGDKALRSAINDYYRRTNQLDKVKEEGVRIIDKVLKITDHDIEEAVLEGARTIEDLQKKTKIGTGDPACLTEAEQLLRFYIEKHFA